MQLNKFYVDVHMREEVKEYLINNLKAQAVSKAFNGEDTTGIMEAKQAVDSAFKDLERLFAEKKVRKQQSNK